MSETKIGSIIGKKGVTNVYAKIGTVVDTLSTTDQWQEGSVSTVRIGDRVSLRDNRRIMTETTQNLLVEFADGSQQRVPFTTEELILYKNQKLICYIMENNKVRTTVRFENADTREQFSDEVDRRRFISINSRVGFVGWVMTLILSVIILAALKGGSSMYFFSDAKLFTWLGATVAIPFIFKIISTGLSQSKANKSCQSICNNFSNVYKSKGLEGFTPKEITLN